MCLCALENCLCRAELWDTAMLAYMRPHVSLGDWLRINYIKLYRITDQMLFHLNVNAEASRWQLFHAFLSRRKTTYLNFFSLSTLNPSVDQCYGLIAFNYLYKLYFTASTLNFGFEFPWIFSYLHLHVVFFSLFHL